MVFIKNNLTAFLIFCMTSLAVGQSFEFIEQGNINNYAGSSYEVIHSLTISQGFTHNYANGNFYARIAENVYYPVSPLIASRNAKIQIVIPEESDPLTIQHGIDVESIDGSEIPGIWSADGRKLEFTPISPYPANTTIEVESNNNLLTSIGIPVIPFQFEFNTMADVSGVAVQNRTNSSIDLSWNPVLGATSYSIEVSNDKDFINIIFNTEITESSLYLSGLNEGTAYFTRISPANETGHSAPTNFASYTTTVANINVSFINGFQYKNDIDWPSAQNPNYTYETSFRKLGSSSSSSGFDHSSSDFEHLQGPGLFYVTVLLKIPPGGAFPIIDNQPFYTFIRSPYNVEISSITESSYSLNWNQSPSDSTLMEIEDIHGNPVLTTYASGGSFTYSGAQSGEFHRIYMHTVVDGGMSSTVNGTVITKPSKPILASIQNGSNNINLQYVIPDEPAHNYVSLSENLQVFLRSSPGSQFAQETKSINISSFSAGETVTIGFFPLLPGSYYIDARFRGNKSVTFPFKWSNNGYHYISDFSDEVAVTIGGFGSRQTKELSSSETIFDEEVQASKAMLYPNPTRGSLTFEFPEEVSSKTEWFMYDPAGQEVIRGVMEEGTKMKVIDVRNLATGLYILNIVQEGVVVENRTVRVEN